MKVKMILPALTEAKSPFWRPIKYSLFPPLGLATLAAYLSEDDEIALQDEHVETLNLDDEPDLVVIQVYITSAYRAYQIADHYRRKGAYVCLGGLHVTSLPEEAAQHADTIFIGPGEDTWPHSCRDFRAGQPKQEICLRGPHAGRPATPPAGSDQAPPLSGAQLHRRLTRLSACLRLLLQGSLLPRRQILLHADGRRGAGARSSACPAGICTFWTIISSATPTSPAALFDGHAGHGTAVAGGRHGPIDPEGRDCSKKPSPAGCAACSSALKLSTRTT